MQETLDAERFGPAALQLGDAGGGEPLLRAHDRNPDRDRGRDRGAVPPRPRRAGRSLGPPRRAMRSAPASSRWRSVTAPWSTTRTPGRIFALDAGRARGCGGSSVVGASTIDRRRRAGDPDRSSRSCARSACWPAPHDRSASADGRPGVTTEVLDLVPELRTDFERRDIGGECVVWSPLAAEPTRARSGRDRDARRDRRRRLDRRAGDRGARGGRRPARDRADVRSRGSSRSFGRAGLLTSSTRELDRGRGDRATASSS